MRTACVCLALVLACAWAQAATSGTTVDLLDALNAGDVRAEFYGAGDQAVTGYVERSAGGPLSLEISPGTQFWAQAGGIQGQTNLGRVPVDLSDTRIAWLTIRTCCTNIGLPAATPDDVMVPVRCPDQRLAKLLGLPQIGAEPQFGVQVAVWALANNPRRAQVWQVVRSHEMAAEAPEGRDAFAAASLGAGASLLRRIGLEPATFRMFR
jgi:hypothetical protein